MTKRLIAPQKRYVFLLAVILTQACLRAGIVSPAALPTARDIEPISTDIAASVTPTLVIEDTPEATVTITGPTETSVPAVMITAVKGNIYIRRGPGMAYNPISVLYKDAGTSVLARDVLSKWVQVVIPGSEKTGWVSLQTEYSKIDGELASLPDITPTDWPVPAYLRNCTIHDMYVMPGEITLPSVYAYPDNEIWLYPGHYTVQDLFVPGKPEVLDFDIREGLEVDIQDDGLGEHRKCH
jgi:hypothetical protein